MAKSPDDQKLCESKHNTEVEILNKRLESIYLKTLNPPSLKSSDDMSDEDRNNSLTLLQFFDQDMVQNSTSSSSPWSLLTEALRRAIQEFCRFPTSNGEIPYLIMINELLKNPSCDINKIEKGAPYSPVYAVLREFWVQQQSVRTRDQFEIFRKSKLHQIIFNLVQFAPINYQLHCLNEKAKRYCILYELNDIFRYYDRNVPIGNVRIENIPIGDESNIEKETINLIVKDMTNQTIRAFEVIQTENIQMDAKAIYLVLKQMVARFTANSTQSKEQNINKIPEKILDSALSAIKEVFEMGYALASFTHPALPLSVAEIIQRYIIVTDINDVGVRRNTYLPAFNRGFSLANKLTDQDIIDVDKMDACEQVVFCRGR